MAKDNGKKGCAKRVIPVDFAQKAFRNCPWLDERGFPLSDKRLKLRSKHWSEEIWKAYLQSLDVPQREPVGLTKDYAVYLAEAANAEDGDASHQYQYEYEPERHKKSDRIQNLTSVVRGEPEQDFSEPIEEVQSGDEPALSPTELVVETYAESDSLDLYAEVQAALDKLTKNEALVIYRLFWEGKSEREIALIMRRSRRSVRVWKERAFSKLKPILSPIYIKYEGKNVSQAIGSSQDPKVTITSSSKTS